MIFNRKIYKDMLKWKEKNGKTALLINGARRVGKSTVAEEFAKREYESYILVDFNEDLDAVKEIFSNFSFSIDTFFSDLAAFYGVSLQERKSVIIFDEVQLFPRVRELVKFLVKDNRYDYILTGSLLSLTQSAENTFISSEEEDLNMYPMDFSEYLDAIGRKDLIKYIKEYFENLRPLPDNMHRNIMTLFRQYMLVGGMPQAVAKFIETNDYIKTHEEKEMIINLYYKDLKFFERDKSFRAALIYENLASNLTDRFSVFKSSDIEGNRFSQLYNSLFVLKDSKIVNIAHDLYEPNTATGLNIKQNRFKIYSGDTGLLISKIFKYNPDIYKRFILNSMDVNLGAVYENVVSQMIVANNHNLNFFTFDKKYEIDFLINYGRKVIPIEVKSSGHKRHKSLDEFILRHHKIISKSYVISQKNLLVENNIIYIPFYMTMFI